MLERYHKMLIGLLVVQVVLIVAVFARGGDNGALGTHLLLPGFDAAKVTRIQIASGDGKSVDLVKKGDKWTVASAFDFPVDDARVADLLTPVAKLAAEEPIATSASRHKQLKVAADDFDRSDRAHRGQQDRDDPARRSGRLAPQRDAVFQRRRRLRGDAVAEPRRRRAARLGRHRLRQGHGQRGDEADRATACDRRHARSWTCARTTTSRGRCRSTARR